MTENTLKPQNVGVILLSLAAFGLLIAGLMLPAGQILGIERSYFDVAGFEKFVMIGSGILVVMMAVWQRHKLINLFVMLVIVSPMIPNIHSWSQEESVADKIGAAVTDPLADMGIKLFFELGSFGIGVICLVASLIAFIATSVLALKNS